MAFFDFLKSLKLPKKAQTGGRGQTSTFPNNRDGAITVPTFQDHLTDIFDSRQADNAKVLIKNLLQHDPDVSGALNGYLTLANTKFTVLAYTAEGDIDEEASRQAARYLDLLGVQTDYSVGFQLKSDIYTKIEEWRYMLLMRGGVSMELVIDKQGEFSEWRNVDLSDIEWREQTNGDPKPIQTISNEEIDLNIPTYFVSFFRRDPTSLYSNSFFVSAINTIAARQQVINDLYRIMRTTGMPRTTVKIVEETLRNNAPADVRADPAKLAEWMNARRTEVAGVFTNMTADQAVVHFDSIEPGIMNEKNPAAGIDISKIIQTLNGQNQSGLKTMATILGRGEEGVNTASTETRLAAMNADAINGPIEDMMSRALTFVMHFKGFQGNVKVTFQNAELRPELELEGQKLSQQSRMLKELSLGLISDAEYHLKVHGRLPPAGSTPLSGTNFLNPAEGGGEGDDGDNSPNSSTERDAQATTPAQEQENEQRNEG